MSTPYEETADGYFEKSERLGWKVTEKGRKELSFFFKQPKGLWLLNEHRCHFYQILETGQIALGARCGKGYARRDGWASTPTISPLDEACPLCLSRGATKPPAREEALRWLEDREMPSTFDY